MERYSVRSSKTGQGDTGWMILEAEKIHYLMGTQYIFGVQCHLINNAPSKVFIHIEKSENRFKGHSFGKALRLVDSYSSRFELAWHVSIISK